MATLTGAVGSVRLLLSASPCSQAQGQGEASGAPWWAFPAATPTGGVIACLAAWFSARLLRRSAQEGLRHEQARLLNERLVTADFDLTGVVIDGGSFRNARFTGGYVSFRGAEFTGDWVRFRNARFTGGKINLHRVWSWKRLPGALASVDGRRRLPCP
ncbi:pentapeptide repeat-containing protein [Streptomyces sp. DSM 40907]|uniref:pentapeptide repeat-containing protein n=1 Tax=Streptomyces kutzneri TaxID=3051179 RepID=UPI0028D6A21A|nr:pentapeptide repeat-containing protein [Streptomyces sp. DSM 40907]